MTTTRETPVVKPTFAAAVRFWLLLGCISFGGPAGQIAVMHTELVDKRKWIDDGAFLRALNFCMLLPGPEAMQLATWLGWRLHGMRGGVIAGALFVLPAALLLAALGWMYMRFGQSPYAAGILFGLQSAVLGIIVYAARKVGARVLKTPFAVALAAAALALIAFTAIPFPLLLLLAAAAGLLVQRVRPAWLGTGTPAQQAPPPARTRAGPGHAVRVVLVGLAVWWLPLLGLALALGRDSTAHAMGLFFSKAALVTFGGAYAVLPYVAREAVEAHGWLDAAQMMAGLGLAETTPGPLVLVLEFVGFVGGWQHPDLASPVASALLGASVAVWATFLPSFIFVLACAPWVDRIGRSGVASTVLSAITAAVVGVIAHLALWFGGSLLAGQSPPAAVVALIIAAVVCLGLMRWRWPIALTVAGAAAVGALVQLWLPVSA